MTANKRWVSFFILVVFGISLSLLAENEEEKLHRELEEADIAYAQYSGHVRQIIDSLAEQMFKELNLVYIGGESGIHKRVEEIHVHFETNRRATVEEARALELYVMNTLLKIINGHEKIQPYLIERPFTYKRVVISLSFRDIHGIYSHNSVEYVSNVTDSAVPENKNKLFLDAYDPFTEKSIDLLNEPYEEAVKLAKASALAFPYFHKSSELEVATDRVLTQFSKMMRISRGLECRSIGGKLTSGFEEIGASFRVFQPASKEQAREIAVYVSEKLLKAITQSKELRPFLKEYPFSADRLKLRFEFVDNGYMNYHDGSMISVVLEANEFSYYHEITIPETDRDEFYWSKDTVLLAKEPYPEALKLVKELPSPPLLGQIRLIPGYLFRWLVALLDP